MRKLKLAIIVLAMISPIASYGWHYAGANMPAQVAEVLIVR